MATKKNNKTCRGLNEHGHPCSGNVKEGNKCCAWHKDMENYTEYEFSNLQECTHCSRTRWRFFPNNGDRCGKCQENYDKFICHACQKDGKTNCRNKSLPGKRYCGIHSYFETYTEEQLQDLKQCSNCLRFICEEFFNGNKTCEDCRNRSINDTIKQKKINEMKPKCNAPNCHNLAKNGNYCGRSLFECMDRFNAI